MQERTSDARRLCALWLIACGACHAGAPAHTTLAPPGEDRSASEGENTTHQAPREERAATTTRPTLQEVLRDALHAFQCLEGTGPAAACEALAEGPLQQEATEPPSCRLATWGQAHATHLCGTWEQGEAFEVEDSLSRFELCAAAAPTGTWADCSAGDERIVDVAVVLRAQNCTEAWPDRGGVTTQWTLHSPSCLIVSGLANGGYVVGFDVDERGTRPGFVRVAPPSD